MKVYNSVQTGPNTHDGGLNDGFTSVAYHVGMAEDVKIDPSNPAELERRMKMMGGRKRRRDGGMNMTETKFLTSITSYLENSFLFPYQ
jgi:hypothetical protein